MTTKQEEGGLLLPCPVCSDQPKWRGSQHDYRAGIYRLQCIGETHLFQAYGPSEEKCIANWNTRAPATPPHNEDGLRKALEEALTPSVDTKIAYSGEIELGFTQIDEFGDEQYTKRLLPWDTIKDVMRLIRERAARQALGEQL